jgi:aminoacrylate hydrolase
LAVPSNRAVDVTLDDRGEGAIMPLAQVAGTEIWHSVQGSGHPLMLLPGLGLDHMYYRLGEPLLRECMTTILVDPRGVGQSRKDDPRTVHYTPELWADDFAALARHLGYESVDVLGSSLGGSMAQAMAVRHPKLVRRLIVVGGFSELDRAMETNFRLRKKMIAKLGMGEEIADFMGLSTMSREFMETEAGLAIMRANQENVRKNSAELYMAFLDSILWWGRRLPGQENEPLYTEKLRAVTCPSLIVAGDNDYFIPASFSKKIAAAIPGARYVEVKGGGHIPFIEKPQETARLVIDFLTR